MQPIVRVFVSSTWLDLQPERLAVEKALQRMRQTKLSGMEYFGSRDDTTRQVSLDEVDRSDVYVGIVGGRYGSGITEEEYRRASEKKLPRFIYIKDDQHISPEGRDSDEANQTRLTAWKEELRKAHALGTGPFTNPDDLATRVTADLSNWLLGNYGAQLYLEGVGSLPFDYAGRIENFLSEYLGTAKAQVPFGGREKDLKALDAWLDDPAAPPYFMMAAPAGRGKSALLVRWTRQVLARANIALVFVPISIRFRMNLSGVTFAALAARLARLHGEKVPETPSTTAEVWRGLVTDYLRRPLPNGETLVVVLDGLDEAADWEPGPDLFPLTPPDHLRVVVSARYRAGDTDVRDWLRRLGWERLELAKSYDLDRLTREGMVHVLVSMGCPLDQLGARVDIVSELYRLTAGDPLLVRLYVEDLWLHKEQVVSLRPENLEMLKPGLEGYFDRWWDDQCTLWGKESPLKERNVQTLLSVLACSLGPLNQEDVLHLTKLSAWDLEEALRPLNRFITGDGKANGYAFSHPRLGYYFKDRLSEREQQDWEGKFLNWGRETVQALETGTLAPAKAPAYIVQYYGAHLEQAHAQAEAMMTLVCHGWSQAWEALEGSFSGFLNDVERAWKAAERENKQAIARGEVAPRIGNEICCALVRASINSLASNIPVELLMQLVRHQKWTFRQALIYARQISEITRRADALAHLTTETKIPDDLRNQTFVETLATLPGVTDGLKHAEVLAALAPYQPEAVLATAQVIADSGARARVLTALAPYRPEAVLAATCAIEDSGDRAQILRALAPHRPEAVLTAARTAIHSWDRAEILAELAPYQPEAVLAAARTSVNSWDRARVLAALLPHVADQDRAPLFQEALAAARTLANIYDCARVLADLVPYVADQDRASLLQDALTAVQAVVNSRDGTDILTVLAPYQPEAVLAAAQAIADSRTRTRVLTALVPHVAEQDRAPLLQEALATARAFDHSEDRAKILTDLLPFVAKQDRGSLLQEALSATRVIADNGARARVLADLVPYVADQDRAPLLQEGLAVARVIGDNRGRTKILATLAPYLPEAVLAATHTIEDSSEHAHVLIALAPYRPEAVLAAARLIVNNGHRAEVLSNLVPLTTESDRPGILQAIRAAAHAIDHSEHRARILTNLVSLTEEQDRGSLLQEALTATHAIEDSGDRAQILSALAPYKPEAVLTVAQELDSSNQCGVVLEALAPYQPEAVFAAAQMIADSGAYVRVLSALAPYKPEAVLTAAQEFDSSNQYGNVLVALAPHRPEAVLAAIHTLKDCNDRAGVLTALVPHVAEKDRGPLLQEALDAAQAADQENLNSGDWLWKRHWGVNAVLTELASHQPAAVLEATHSIVDSEGRGQILRALAPHQPEAVLAAARMIANSRSRAEVLTDLVPLVAESDRRTVLQEALVAAQAVNSETLTNVLAALAPHIRLLAPPCLYSFWCATWRHLSTSTREELTEKLSSLIPIIEEFGQNRALEDILRSLQDVTTWWP